MIMFKVSRYLSGYLKESFLPGATVDGSEIPRPTNHRLDGLKTRRK